MSGPIVVEHAPGCGAAPVLVFALEELGLPYTRMLRPSGHFVSEHGRPGPLLRVGDAAHVGLSAALVSLADDRERALIESFARSFDPALRALFTNAGDDAARAALERALDDLGETLGDRKFLLGVPTIADCIGLVVRVVSRLGVDLGRWPTLVAYRDRMMERPAWARATTATGELDPETVLRFWFGDAPAATEEALLTKLRRWFQGGSELDAEIATRFTGTIERALAGGLDAWSHTPRGRLALVLVLDQFTRNVFRADRRAYAGDARAQELVLDALAKKMNLALGHEERMFLNMPLVHAEDRGLQGRAVLEAERLVEGGPSELRGMLGMGVEQATKYRDIIARFGRFPHRNAILGRTSTQEEETFLIDWMEKAPPSKMRGA